MSTVSKSTQSTAISTLIWSIHRGKRIYSNKRLVHKNGDFNIAQTGIKKRKQQYLADIFTTLIDLKWVWSLTIFMAVFILTWFIFAVMWWSIAKVKGDLDNLDNRNWTHCVNGVDGFFSAMLFSIETQHTIGYGTRSVTKNCAEALLMLMIQSTMGVIIQALMTGLVFAKLARPQKRAETLMFSKFACICQRDGKLVLLFRVGDMRASHLIGARIDALVIRRNVTTEGEIIPLTMATLNLGYANKRLLLRWPVVVEHTIDEDSPLYKLSRQDLEQENFEILIILEGSVPSTGANTQAVTSYLPEEIMWGYRFHRLMTNLRDDGKYVLDYKDFQTIQQVKTPECSAEELNRRKPKPSPATGEKTPKKTQTDFDLITKWMGASAMVSEEEAEGCTSGRQIEISNDGGAKINETDGDLVQGDKDADEMNYVRVSCKTQQTGSPLLELPNLNDNGGYISEECDPCTIMTACNNYTTQSS